MGGVNDTADQWWAVSMALLSAEPDQTIFSNIFAISSVMQIVLQI
jgi:hypothetical protein